MSRILIPLLLFCTLSLSSCYQNMHFADRANSPGLTKRGELKAVAAFKPTVSEAVPDTTGARSINTSVVSPEIDVAYAITDHIAITAGYTSVLNRYVEENRVRGLGRDRTRSYYDTTIGGLIVLHGGEVGAGYFGKTNKAFKYGIYGTLGFGGVKRRGIVLPNYNYTTNFFKYSIQPEVGLGPNGGKIFSFTAGGRITGFKYYNFKSNDPLTKYAVGEYSPKYGLDVTNRMFYYFEPYVNLEVGYQFVKFNFQVGFTAGLSDESTSIGDSPYLSIGVLFHRDPAYF